MKCAIALVVLSAGALWGATAREESFAAANGLTITVKMVAPGNEPSPMQVICYLKHKPAGDKVTEALVEFDRKMGGIVQALRDRDEFSGNELETLFFLTPKDSLKARSLLLIGLGDAANLSLETMSRVGAVALREAVRLKMPSVSYASAIKDQGVDKLEAGEVAGAVVRSVILGYDTEKRLQKQGLAAEFSIRQWIYEAGPAYFQSTVNHVRTATQAASAEASHRTGAAYSSRP